MKRWLLGPFALLFVAAVWIITFLCFNAYRGCDSGQGLANLGQFFGLLSALFSGLAFAGVLWTIPFLKDQAAAAREQTDATARQNLFLSLSQRVGEVISDLEISRMPRNSAFLQLVEPGIPQIISRSDSDSKFLDLISKLLRSYQVPVNDRFRRQALFRALQKLFSSSSGFQRELFRDALNAQIHDQAAWMIILKSLAEADGETLRIYGELGISFDALHQSPSLCAEVKKRFSPRLPRLNP